MTLVGKIFIVAIFIMSLVYMAFAMAIYSTHKNWRAVVLRTADEASATGQPVGLKIQYEQRLAENKELKEQLLRADNELAAEREVYRQNLAKAESQYQTILDQSKQLQTQLEAATEEKRRLNGLVDSTQQTNTKLTQENENLRGEIRDTQLARDNIFLELSEKKDDLHQKVLELASLKEREAQLLRDLAKYRRVLAARGINPDAPIDTIPPIDGIVTAVRGSDLIEVSIGSDDGLEEGHFLEIYRGETYVGRAIVLRTAPDRAVAQILKEFVKSNVQKGDRVATRLKVG